MKLESLTLGALLAMTAHLWRRLRSRPVTAIGSVVAAIGRDRPLSSIGKGGADPSAFHKAFFALHGRRDLVLRSPVGPSA